MLLNGSKVFITNGGEADVYIVFAVTEAKLGGKGITAFIVEKNTPGLIFGKDEHKMGLRGSRTYSSALKICIFRWKIVLAKKEKALKLPSQILKPAGLALPPKR